MNTIIKNQQKQLYHVGQKYSVEKWQGVDSPDDMIELLNQRVVIDTSLLKNKLEEEIKPHLPWAELQFQERVSGKPLNPGESYKEWPFYKHKKEDDKFRNTEEGQFSHTYMERFWPKQAPMFNGRINADINIGIRYGYGDLDDLIQLLMDQPHTRQAFLPIWFPEDLKASNLGDRVPCSLGYDFIIRNNRLHMVYYMRSCDALRHFRDDIYIAIRLMQWVCQELNMLHDIDTGMFTMYIKNFHCFYKERESLLSDKF
jgi:hypothetical protein